MRRRLALQDYVADTSSLINLQQYYPRPAFSALWDNVGSLIREGRMVAPMQVLKELESKDDDLLGWARQHKTMFQKNKNVDIKFATMLANKYSTMRNKNVAVERADRYVIALAHRLTHERLTGKWVVVTEEGDGLSQIPQISKSYKVDYCKLVDVIVEEGWSFR